MLTVSRVKEINFFHENSDSWRKFEKHTFLNIFIKRQIFWQNLFIKKTHTLTVEDFFVCSATPSKFLCKTKIQRTQFYQDPGNTTEARRIFVSTCNIQKVGTNLFRYGTTHFLKDTAFTVLS